MATYSTDFSEYTSASPPGDWTIDPISTAVIVDAGGGVHFLRLSAADGDRTGLAFWNDVAADPDVDELEILAQFAYPGGIDQFFEGVGVVASQSGSPFNQYNASLQRDGYGFDYSGQGVALQASAGIQLGTDAFTLPTAGDLVWLRMRLSATAGTIQVWYWEDGDTPKVNTDTPDISASNSAYQPVGRAGLFRDAELASHNLECYWFSAGTNGDAAPLPGGGGGGVELVVADSIHGHVADSPSLTQASALIVGEAVHAHVADSVALSQGFTLAVSGSVHSHLADAMSLSQASALDAQSSAHSQHSDQPALTQAGALEVGESVHGHYSDLVALIQASALSVADSVHMHASDSPVLSQSQLLSVGDSVHAIVTEALELTQAHVLAVESAVHAHISDGIDLSTSGSLAVGGSVHGHFADAPQLVQASILTIGESVHTLVSAQIALSQGVVMTVQDAVHSHVTDGVTLSHGAILAIASAVHLHGADAIGLTQSTTIVVSDSVHAHIASQINLLMPGGLAVPPGRTIVVQAQDRVIVIQPENRTFRMH